MLGLFRPFWIQQILQKCRTASSFFCFLQIFEELQEVQAAMAQPVANIESDSELEKELAEIMGEATNDPSKSLTKFDKSNISAELPDLKDLNLRGNFLYPKKKFTKNLKKSFTDLPAPKTTLDSLRSQLKELS